MSVLFPARMTKDRSKPILTRLLPAAVLGLCASLSLFGQAKSPPANFKDEGVFLVYQANRVIAVEEFSIEIDRSGIRAEGKTEFRVNPITKGSSSKSVAELRLDGSWGLVSYRWRQTQTGGRGAKIQVTFKDKMVQVAVSPAEGPRQKRKFILSPDVAILDNNFMHHYGLLLKRFDPKRGGWQMFQVFIPQQVEPGLVTVEAKAKEEVDLDLDGGRKARLNRYDIQSNSLKLTVWADDQGRLQRLSSPQQRIQIFRKR